MKNHNNTEVAAIVDPYSSGAYLAPEFEARGYQCLSIQSSKEIPPLKQSSYHPDQFHEIVVHNGDIEDTLAQLRRHSIRLVIAGSESGVELADQLSERLGLPTNGTKFSEARVDKSVMIETVGKSGLAVPQQFHSNQLDQVIHWIQMRGIWPVIVKPPKSSGSEDVFFCATEAEVEKAFNRIMHKRNMLGTINKEVIVQEYIQGTEYVFDTVSCRGQHRLAAIWKYGKPNGDCSFVCYDSMELLPSDGDIQGELFSYAAAVLDAVGIQYGAAHCEIMWIEGAPVLVEIGARMSGGNNAVIGRTCCDTCQLDLTVEAYLEPERFLDCKSHLYRLEKRAANYFLMPGREGMLRALPRLNEIEKLSSFFKMSVGAKPGQPVRKVIGVITLVHAYKDVLESDIAHIRHMEQDGFYEFDLTQKQ